MPQALIRTRAWENQIYVAYANRDGEENGLTYVGRSLIAAPDGDVLDQCEHGSGLLYGSVDARYVVEQQRRNPYLDDRQHELYDAGTAIPSSRP